MDAYLRAVAVQVDKYQHYPDLARRFGDEGRVRVRLVLARDGKLLEARVAQSSGIERLDKAALATVERAAPFPPFPPDVNRDKLALVLPINYVLRGPK